MIFCMILKSLTGNSESEEDMRFGALAQLGERIAGSDEVRGSIPLGSTTNIYGLLAQLVEQLTLNQLVQGSSP
jgi:hypothetical protein